MTAYFTDPGSIKGRGAFYTPDSLARVIADWIVRSGSEHILEPSVGDGALAKAISEQSARLRGGVAAISLSCCDIDSIAAATVAAQNPSYHVIERNFLETSKNELGQFDAVAMNPPFTRNHSIPRESRDRLRAKFDVAGPAGLWVYFLLHAVSFLRADGRLAAILPASATFTNYGRVVLDRVANDFSSIEIRRIVDRPTWANGAEEKGAILFAEGHLRGRSELPSLTSWTSSGQRKADFFSGNPSFYRLARQNCFAFNELAEISIGCVTGLNKTFLLSEDERRYANIGLEDVIPVVSRVRHVRGLLINKLGLLALAEAGEKTWLLSPKTLGSRGSSVRNWLARIPSSKRRSTLWLNKRTPWWQVDISKRCDAIFTYMNHLGPRLVQVENGVKCTNTLHRVAFGRQVGLLQRNAASLSLISTFGQLSAELDGRTYGGGVLKFEIQDVRALPILKGNMRCRSDNLRKAHDYCAAGEPERACALADEILMPKIFGTDWKLAVAEMKKELWARRSERLGSG